MNAEGVELGQDSQNLVIKQPDALKSGPNVFHL